MKKYLFFFILILFLSFYTTYASSVSSTGFIPGQIWYSNDSMVEGDTIKIYTAVWNDASSDLSAKVEFYDQNVILGTRDVIVPSMQIVQTSVSWKVTAGDHNITAKIISPTVIVSGKKENVSLDNTLTESSHKFIPVLIKTASGDKATSNDVLKSQIEKAASVVNDILPSSVPLPMSQSLDSVSNFRENTSDKISAMKDATQKTIDALSKKEVVINTKTDTKNPSVVPAKANDATEKPIAYIKLFFLSILSFIFGSSFVFYAIIVILLFLVLRWIYSKIRNKY